MKAHFEMNGTVTPKDVVEFLRSKGLHGQWECYELNIFRLKTAYCDDEYSRLADICNQETIIFPGGTARGLMIMPRKPK
jgi:hypothetical protein